MELAAIEDMPEIAVFLAFTILTVNKDAVVFTFHFVKGVTHNIQEVLIGIQNSTVHREFDPRHTEIQCGHHGFQLLLALANSGT